MWFLMLSGRLFNSGMNSKRQFFYLRLPMNGITSVYRISKL
jgi:hypothetical protein